MNPEAIRRAHAARPYQPFVLHLADSRSFPVPHPEFMAIGPGGRNIIVFRDADWWDVLDVIMITGIEIGNPGAKQPAAPT
jgi:hypothetical protein